jgi:4-aminobutyrate aminotransferase-like enzyme
LSRLTFERWTHRATRCSGKTIFCNSGFEAVEAALKTVALATGRSGIIAFEGGYHGLGYGALNATHRDHFRKPFRSQLGEFGSFVPFPLLSSRQPHKPLKALRANAADLPVVIERIRALFRRKSIGAILVEPIQARGGINVPPVEFLPSLRQLCDEHGALLVLDEIYTGFGRTGKWFAAEHTGVVPDIVCLGKALTGGFPLSACVGRASVMDAAWPASRGEAIHTSTYLGHPVGCAMALAQIGEIERLKLVKQSHRLGGILLAELDSLAAGCTTLRVTARGLGLMAGLEIRQLDGSPATVEGIKIIKAMLARGFMLLPEGEHANVISFTPPLTITETQLQRAVAALAEVLR